MKFTSACLVALIGSVFTIQSEAAIYMKFDGVDGESKAAVSMVFGDASQCPEVSAAQATRGRRLATGLPTGKRQHKPIRVMKRIDQTTPLLMQGDSNPRVQIRVEQTNNKDPSGKPSYITYELENVMISSYSLSASADGEVIEDVCIQAESVRTAVEIADDIRK